MYKETRGIVNKAVMHMTEEFDKKLKKKIGAYKSWAENRAFSSCRLVHYVGVDRPNVVDVELGEVINQITGCLAEGFYIDWHEQDSRFALDLVAKAPWLVLPALSEYQEN